MIPGRLAAWLRGEGADPSKNISKAGAEKAIQAANDKRARRKARPQGARP
jgi:hypothetical protein